MLLLKLMSQAIAQKQKRKSVTIADVREAVSMLELNESALAKNVLKYLAIDRPQRSSPPELIMKLVQSISGEGLPWSNEVMQLLNDCGGEPFYKSPALLRSDQRFLIDAAHCLPEVEGTRASVFSSSSQDASDLGETSQRATRLQASKRAGGKSASKGLAANGKDGSFLHLPIVKLAELARELRVFFSERLHGQDHVIDALADGLLTQALRGDRKGPLACLFLVGPSGTGKSHTVELIIQALEKTGTDWPLKVINMGSLQSANQAFVLTGLSRGYDSASPGELTDFVRRNPRSIVVLDNLDKAHPNNQNVLLPVFDTGYLTDQYGFFQNNDFAKPKLAPDEVDFRNTILVFTTNAGAGSLTNADFQAYLQTHPGEAKAAVVDVLSNQVGSFRDGPLLSFSPELLSRLSAELMLIYRPLPLKALEAIAKTTWDAFVGNLKTAYGAVVAADDLKGILSAATLWFGGHVDARKVAGSQLENLLFEGVVDQLQELKEGETVSKIRFQLGKGFTTNLKEMIDKLGGADVVRELHRKQRKLDFDLTTARGANGDIVAVFTEPRWATITRAGDLGGRGGLQTVIPACSFEDIAGHERVKTKLNEVIRVMNEPGKLLEWGVSLPRGMLLFGPPGTGKTMLAKALAKEADMPFIASTGPDMLDIEHMHKVFERARHYAPSVLFIDEIDVLGSRKSGGYAVPINQLLAELDGFASQAGGVFTVAATNYPEKIDPAILRAGRLDLHVEVPALDPPARSYFFERLRSLPGGPTLDLEELVRLSSGTTGADLERVRRELGLQLLRSGAAGVTQADAVELISVVKYGERRDVNSSKLALEHTAYHEAGHAIVSMVLRPDRKLEQITIVPRARAAGFTAFRTVETQRPMTRDDVLNELAIYLGGRVAQQIKYGDQGIDAGASDDLQKATALALLAIGSWGMDEVVGNRTLSMAGSEVSVAQLPPGRIEWWFSEARSRAQKILETRRSLLDLTAIELCAQETLSQEQFEAIERDMN